MTRREYETVRQEEPDLRLPSYAQLRDDARRRLFLYDRSTLIARRVYQLLARDWDVVDALR